jgi:hypothetical protein
VRAPAEPVTPEHGSALFHAVRCRFAGPRVGSFLPAPQPCDVHHPSPPVHCGGTARPGRRLPPPMTPRSAPPPRLDLVTKHRGLDHAWFPNVAPADAVLGWRSVLCYPRHSPPALGSRWSGKIRPARDDLLMGTTRLARDVEWAPTIYPSNIVAAYCPGRNGRSQHSAPRWNCDCGVFAVTHLRAFDSPAYPVRLHCAVALTAQWGDLVLGSDQDFPDASPAIWRSTYSQFLHVLVSSEVANTTTQRDVLATLAERYRCDAAAVPAPSTYRGSDTRLLPIQTFVAAARRLGLPVIDDNPDAHALG